ncbi:MAG: hypothetical protein AAF791_14485 [Bacteroidota bacterium]
MRLSPRQFLALALFPLIGMMACDVPLPPGGTTSATLPDLADATVRQGTLGPGDGVRLADRYQDEVATVTVSPGATLAVVLDSDAFDPYLTIEITPGQQAVTNDDWNGSRQRSAVVQTNTSSVPVTARILASSYASGATGAYTLRYLVEEPPPVPEGRTISVPGSVPGLLTSSTPRVPLTSNDAERPADAYSFQLADGQQVTVRMESSNFDTYLKVLRDGVFHARNDDFGGSRSVSQLDIRGPGTFTVLAGAFSASANTGAYSLAFTSSSDAPPPKADEPQTRLDGPGLPLGRSGGLYNGELTDSDRDVPLTINNDRRKADVHHIELNAGDTFVVTMESQSFDTYLKMERDGQFVARNDDAGSTRRSEIRHTASVGGTYVVYAGTFASTGRGSYQLTWRIE